MRYCPKCKAQYTDDQAICPIDGSILNDKTVSPKPSAKDEDPFIGRVIADKYKINKLIGRGGMGAVYEAQHLLLERIVAVKVLHQNLITDERAAGRFIREARSAAKIEHPNAVIIHDFGVLKDGSAYLVMEYIRGKSLRQLLLECSHVDIEQAINWVIQVCNVVEIAHQQGIIHRDLKPENVMLKESTDGSVVVKVVDFGIAKLISGDSQLTQPGEVLGTPRYMAPEYYEGEEADHRADIYALGIIMYEMLCGDTPFTGTVQSVIGGHLFKDPLPIFEANPSIHPTINAVVQKALKKKREERINSAAEFGRQLKAAWEEVSKIYQAKTLVSTPVFSKDRGVESPTLMGMSGQLTAVQDLGDLLSERPTSFSNSGQHTLNQHLSELNLPSPPQAINSAAHTGAMGADRSTGTMKMNAPVVLDNRAPVDPKATQRVLESQKLAEPPKNTQKISHDTSDVGKRTDWGEVRSPGTGLITPEDDPLKKASVNLPRYVEEPEVLSAPPTKPMVVPDQALHPSVEDMPPAPKTVSMEQGPILAQAQAASAQVIPPTMANIPPTIVTVPPTGKLNTDSSAEEPPMEGFMEMIGAIKNQLILGTIISIVLGLAAAFIIGHYLENHNPTTSTVSSQP